MPADHLLDALVFSSPGRCWRDVMAAGRFVIADQRLAGAELRKRGFESAIRELWGRVIASFGCEAGRSRHRA